MFWQYNLVEKKVIFNLKYNFIFISHNELKRCFSWFLAAKCTCIKETFYL